MSKESLKYQLSTHLADGGMASLYKVSLEGGKPAVLRKMHNSKCLNLPLHLRFRQGAAIRARLSPHPNIVNSLEWGSHFLGPYEILEYVNGVPLRNLMTLGDSMLKANTFFVIQEMAQALAWVHENGIMHLDVKPENFLLEKRGSKFILKLTDFDLSRDKDDHGPRKQLGTPGYMAPEQFLKKLSYQASDVFAFGIICYQLLSGKLPFSGKTQKDTWRHQASATVQPRPIHEYVQEVDPRLEFVVMNCLKKPLDERYENMTQVLQALVKIVL